MRYYRIRWTNSPYESSETIMESDYLCHYGVKGQKWGVRRFQNEDGTYTAAGKERYAHGDASHKQNSVISDNSNTSAVKVRFRDRSAIDAANSIDLMSKQDLTKVIDRNKSKHGDTKNAKMQTAFNVINTVLNPLNAVFLAKQGIDYAVANHNMNSYMKKREQNSAFDSDVGLYMKHDGQYNEQQDLAAVNPGFKNFNSNTKNNCMLCTTTYDLRKRGYDVTAQLDSEGYNFGDIKRWYPNAIFEKSTRINSDGSVMKQKDYIRNTVNMIEQQGDGARGNLMVWFKTGMNGVGGGGHSMVYEVQNGKMIIKDGQTGKIYKKPEQILAMTDASSFVRLDNVEPDLKRIIAECVR